jgi:predicted amidohydrolase
VFLNRRPELYKVLTEPPNSVQLSQGYAEAGGATELNVALVRPPASVEGEAALRAVVTEISGLDESVELVVLPELFWCLDAQAGDRPTEVTFSQQVSAQLEAICTQHGLHIATSLIDVCAAGYQHVAVLIGPEGRVATQPQVHRAERHNWSQLGDDVSLIDMPWGRCALLAGDDSVYPELVKVLALQGVHVLLLPFDCQESWENNFGLLSRAAENRMCVVASSRATASGSGLICSLESEFTIMTQWQDRKFDGHINYPITTHQQQAVTQAVINPAAAANKLMSMNTDLLLQRPWHLSEALVS